MAVGGAVIGNIRPKGKASRPSGLSREHLIRLLKKRMEPVEIIR
jgi:hypothetical protein